MSLKNEMLEMMTRIGQEVKLMMEKPELYLEAVKADPATKYRMDIFSALQELGLPNEVTAQITLAVKLNVNTYDSDISKAFCSEMLLPILKLNYANHLQIPVHGALNKKDMLISFAQNCEIKYQL